jgi:hypothetical protein
MSKTHKLYLTQSDLKLRGWSGPGIEKNFKEPDKYSPKEKEALYLRKRVERVERVVGVS